MRPRLRWYPGDSGGGEISDLGRSLAPVFAALVDWSVTHLDGVEAARTEYDAGQRPTT